MGNSSTEPGVVKAHTRLDNILCRLEKLERINGVSRAAMNLYVLASQRFFSLSLPGIPTAETVSRLHRMGWVAVLKASDEPVPTPLWNEAVEWLATGPDTTSTPYRFGYEEEQAMRDILRSVLAACHQPDPEELVERMAPLETPTGD